MSNVEVHMDLPWEWYYISLNPNLPTVMIEADPDEEWDWDGISRYMKLTVDLLKNMLISHGILMK